MKRILLSLLLINLFFIGFLVGVIFIKQNINHSILSADPLVNYQSLSVSKRVELCLTGFGIALNLSTQSIFDSWRNLFKTGSFLNKGNFPGKRIIHNAVVGDNRPLLSTKIPNKEEAFDKVIPKSPKVNLPIKNYQPVNLIAPTLTPKPFKSRSDPFLSLSGKFQAREDSKIKGDILKKIITKEKPKIVDPEKLQVIQEPKVVEKLKTGQENETDQILKKYHLRGIVMGSSPAAYFEDQNGLQKVIIGDSFAGGKIINITTTNVTIQFGDEQVNINLEGQQ